MGWSRPARLARGVVLSAKERNYVVAARGFGATELYLLRRHVLPQTKGVILTQAAVLIPQYILAEVTLSFLGLGVADPVPSWGNMLSALQQHSVLASYWWMIIPGILLIPVFLGYYFLAQSLELRVESSPFRWKSDGTLIDAFGQTVEFSIPASASNAQRRQWQR